MTRTTLFASRVLAVAALTSVLAVSFPRHAMAREAMMPDGSSIDVRPAGSETEEVLRLRIEVSYKGWNGNPEFKIEAVEGQQVELTFVWADTAVPDNAHRIRIKGYDLQSQLIDVDNRETVLSFIADKTGTFELACDWRCEGHKDALESGLLLVMPSGTSGDSNPGTGSSSSRFLPTSLALSAETSNTDTPIQLSAALTDEAGEPVSGAKVVFLVDRTFAGTEGEMEIGFAETDAEGTAVLAYSPAFSGLQTVTARFAGVGLYAPAEQVSVIDVGQVGPAYTVASKGLDGIRTWMPPMVFLVVGAIWLTFAFVLVQVFQIRTDTGRE